MWLLLFTCTFLFVVLGTSRVITVYDEGLILEGANRVANGAFPHRDFYTNYGPAQFFVLALLFKIFSPAVLVERVWDAFVRTATAMLIAYMAFRLMSRFLSYLALLVCLVWLVFLGFPGYPVFPALLFTLVSVALLLPGFDGQHSHFRLACAGVATALVALFRYDVGFYCFVAETLALGAFLLLHSREGRNRRSNTLAIMTYVGGAAVILVPLALLYWAAGAVSDFWFNFVSLTWHTYPHMRRLPFPRPGLSTIPVLIIYFLPFAWASAAFYLVARARSDRHPTNHDLVLSKLLGKRTWPIILLCTVSVILSLKGFVRIGPIGLALAIVPAILLFFVVCDTSAERKKAPFLILTGITTLILLSSTTVAFRRVCGTLHQNLSWLISSQSSTPAVDPSAGTCHPSSGLERISCFTLNSSRIAAIEYLQKHMRENEPIFVGLGRHDKIYINDNAFYFAAKLRPATKWYQFEPGVQTSEKIQREIIIELETVKPRYVVLETEWDNVIEPNSSAISSGVLLLDDYIRTRYKPVAMFETITVMERT
jgi:4-amino-4-deoxy-L-arabinose transferase and related glycosyltransferases of PMT family